MTRAADILKSKPEAVVHTIGPAASVYEAVKLMADKGIGALLVTEGEGEGERLVGIVTERDYARKMVLMGRSSKETAVSEIMTRSVMFVRPDQTTDACMALMTTNRLRHLPVMDGERVLGMVSIGDLVKDIISQQQFIIAQLENYIAGAPGH
jgi:CBS domain-containing protein